MGWWDFNPRPRRGATPDQDKTKGRVGHFNPRPPRGGRPVWEPRNTSRCTFQSTPPRGATSLGAKKYVTVYISIHAPREGATFAAGGQDDLIADFNPRPLRGGRPAPLRHHRQAPYIISIHAPREGATAAGIVYPILDFVISIHAPREGGATKAQNRHGAILQDFNPRPPQGGDDCPADHSASPEKFQSTPPRGGRRTGDAHANRDV